MMKGIARQFIRLATIGKLAVVIVSLMGFAAVADAQNDIKNSTETSQRTAASKAIKDEPAVTHITETLTEEIPYSSTRVENPFLEKGKTQVKVQGVKGARTSIYQVTYTNGVETARLHISTETISTPVDEVVEVGSKTNDASPTPAPAPTPNKTPDDDPVRCEDGGSNSGRHRREVCSDND